MSHASELALRLGWSCRGAKSFDVYYGTFGSTNADRQLASTGSLGLAQEAALVGGQDAVIDARPVHPHFTGVRSALNLDDER